jgi:hypothetical protein
VGDGGDFPVVCWLRVDLGGILGAFVRRTHRDTLPPRMIQTRLLYFSPRHCSYLLGLRWAALAAVERLLLIFVFYVVSPTTTASLGTDTRALLLQVSKATSIRLLLFFYTTMDAAQRESELAKEKRKREAESDDADSGDDVRLFVPSASASHLILKKKPL